MRKLLLIATVAPLVLAWTHQAPAAGNTLNQNRFMDSICFQGFGGLKVSEKLPAGNCDTETDTPDRFKWALWDVVQHAAPEIQQLFADPAVDTLIFIRKEPKAGSAAKPPPSSPQASATAVDTGGQAAMKVPLGSQGGGVSWVAWGQRPDPGGAQKNTLFIGISEMVFDGSYSLPIHETAKLMELFWSPDTPGAPGHSPPYPHYSPGQMPQFLPAISTTGYMGSGQLAIYAILAHEIAHYWQFRYGIYKSSDDATTQPNPSNIKACVPTRDDGLKGFPSYSWGNYMKGQSSPGDNEYFPPWIQQGGIWGCPTPGSETEKVQDFIYNHIPWIDQPTSTPNKGAVSKWPDPATPSVPETIDNLYAKTNLPSVLAATSPEEDFAETYTMLALYNAGLRSLCLSLPQPADTAHQTIPDRDVIDTLFNQLTGSLTRKVDWIVAQLPRQTDDTGAKFKDTYGAITPPTKLPVKAGCQ